MRDYPDDDRVRWTMSSRCRAGCARCSAAGRCWTPPARCTCGNGRTTRSTTSRLTDVDPALLVDEEHVAAAARAAPADRHGAAGRRRRPGPPRPGCHRTTPLDGPGGHGPARVGRARRLVRGGRAGLRPPPQPVRRVDALRSTRPVRVELDGVVLAESASPVMVFETGLPTRYYLTAHRRRLQPPGAHRHRDRVPVQGHARAATGRCGPAETVAPRPGLGLRLPDPPAAADRRA